MQRTIKYEKIKTQEKNYKIYFLWKKMRPKSVVLREKAPSERKFMLNKWVSRYLSFGDFNVPKKCSSQ